MWVHSSMLSGSMCFAFHSEQFYNLLIILVINMMAQHITFHKAIIVKIRIFIK